jgi:hypothetical protein
MKLNPSRLLVSWAGFVYDWIITREWKRVVLYLLPAIVFGGLGMAVTVGSWLDRGLLAQRYLEFGNEQIADWEQGLGTCAERIVDGSDYRDTRNRKRRGACPKLYQKTPMR